MTREEKSTRNAELIELRKSGMPIKDIAGKYRLSETTMAQRYAETIIRALTM